jgi:hypothetical protein
MSDAVQSKIGNPPQQAKRGASKSATRRLINGLFAEWPKVSAGIDAEPLEGETSRDCEKRLRLQWTNEQLREFYAKKGGRFTRINGKTVFIKCDNAMVESWNELHEQEIRFLQKRMWEATGGAAEWRIKKLRELAAALCGDKAETYIRTRLIDRFQVALDGMTPKHFQALREEIQSQIARREIVAAGDEVTGETVEHKMEEVRERFSPQRH